MQRVYNSVLESIGQTPLIKLNNIGKQLPCPVYGKVEFFNPGASVKDRVALAMIEEAEATGTITPGKTTIIEATSGNTGVGLALVAAVKGYRCIFVMPDKMSDEKINLLKAYGGEVVIVPTNVPSESPDGYSGVAKRLQNEIPNAWMPNQFGNLTNPECHYRTTGPEIWQQTDGKVTVFVNGIGTGGTISGVGQYLKEKNPKITIVGADPEGSILSGGAPQPWAVEGIGEDYVPQTFNSQVVDEWVRVNDRDSFRAARLVAQQEGLLIGGSCGTSVAAALRYAERLTPNDVVVVMMPDTGRNYLSKVYNDDWMRERGYLDDVRKPATAAEVLVALGQRKLHALTPDHTLQDAIDLLHSESISQVPILDGDRVVGGVQEITLARLLHEGRNPREIKLGDVTTRALPEVDAACSVDEIYRRLMSGDSAVLVRREGELAGIITRIDLVNYWDQPIAAGV